MGLLELLLASGAYAVGGLFMKLSAGLANPGPTAAFLALFLLGAVVQALGMGQTDLGVAYILVLGVEAVVTLGLSVGYLHETCPPSRLAAVGLVLAGIAWLRRT
jgi:multidrug transporter EmrE-like cation transporter